ncbi:MAG: ATPase [Ectothiorhodospiraceae bacterium]|nr:ATPase [Ectothiorhodospiraceae bacterium]
MNQQHTSGRLYLGVDGGGTHCRARLYAPSGHPLGEGRAGSASARQQTDIVWEHILAATRGALTAAGLDEGRMADIHAGLGLAGALDEEQQRSIADYPNPFASVRVISDAQAAVLGAFGGGDGGVLIIGTGSCGMALIEGRFRSVGGWGFPLSDHASGAWIGLQALRSALLCREGLGPASVLAERILQAFDNDIPAMVRWQYTALPRDYARFAPEVFRAAAEGDALAGELLESALDEALMLARGVLALGARRLCLLGGVAQGMEPMLAPRLQQPLSHPQGDAMDGALRLITTSGDVQP